jgi:hypothetical protein
MNCCSEYGDCTQGRDCPARTGKVLPHQAAHAQRVARVKSSCPVWMDGKASTVPPEAGNFKIIELGPDDTPLYDGQPLTHDENRALVRTLLVWLAGVVSAVTLVSVLVSFGTERFSDALWALLQGVS